MNEVFQNENSFRPVFPSVKQTFRPLFFGGGWSLIKVEVLLMSQRSGGIT